MLRADRSGAPRIQADILRLPTRDASVDGVTCGFALRNVISLDALFAEIARVVRRGGRIALLEAARPANRVARAGHAVYFDRIVPLIGGALSDAEAYRYLPRSMAYLPEPDGLLAMLRGAGFDDARRRTFGAGAAQLLTGTRS
jgi:demethylmenaquinone methyltransferase/2-methoxy-6-polyprenyl-1,4-benzoquinol methylase